MIRHIAFISTAAACLLASCGEEKPAAPATPGAPAAPAAATPAADLSTPNRAMIAFINAAKTKDKAGMTRCIASGAEKELRDLRNNTASDKQWTEWMDGMGAATLGEMTMDGTDRATVVITTNGRRETVKMVKDGANWLLMGM